MQDHAFLKIIDATPLVSIDLILKNSSGEALLGKRLNRPAQGYWFVPGGRIRKNEEIVNAIKRISSTELGLELSFNQMKLLGGFDHIYTDNYLGEKGVNTHYVVLAFMIELEQEVKIIADDQHSEMKWWPTNSLLQSDQVHLNTKRYFDL